jgi:hypothetical protein
LPGDPGPPGADGAPGSVGPAGPPAALNFAEFYALMPSDNALPVVVGSDVDFPRDGPASGNIVRTGVDTFKLPTTGTYRVSFSASVTEAGQLDLTLNGNELPYTVYGRATGTSLISGDTLVTTPGPDAVISVRNPTGNTTALTITPAAGGTQPAVASIVIQLLK